MKKLRLHFMWHMHQPYYRDELHGEYHLPWVYLHAMKDYTDMAWHLENEPEARAVVNFAPVLLEQIADYAEQIGAWLEQGRRIGDPVLAALAGPGLPADMPSRRDLVRACLRANEKHLINRFPVLKELVGMAHCGERDPFAAMYFSDQFLVDLLVWYHLGWMGEGAREVSLSYVIEAPVWKTSYRVLLDDKEPTIQGWALVDNTQDEDWEDVQLTLVAGLPISFVHDLYSPRYKRRPVVHVQ